MNPTNLTISWEEAMKEDMDLMRDVLFRVEESKHPGIDNLSLKAIFKDYTAEKLTYHIKLLKQSDLIDAHEVFDPSTEIGWIIEGLTPSGHAFVAAARNDNRWNKTKNFVVEKVGAIALTYLSQTLLGDALRSLGL